MLPKEHRLRKQTDFDRVYKRGRTKRTPFFILRADKAETKRARFAVVVSSKVSKNAVDRNRVRRRTQAALRNLLKQGVKPVDVVINMGPQAKKAETVDLEKQLRKALMDLKLLS